MSGPRWRGFARTGAFADGAAFLAWCLCRPWWAAQALPSTVAAVSTGILSIEQVLALLRACPSSPAGLRARALIVTPWRGGLRLAEMLALCPEDLDVAAGRLSVAGGRVVQLDRAAVGVVEAWRLARAARVQVQGPLFCTMRGAVLDASYVRRELRALADRAGVVDPVSPEVLRRTLGAELGSEGYSLSEIRQQLGQASTRSAGAYLRNVPAEGEAGARLAHRSWPVVPPDACGAESA